ncbi:Metallo-dependent phosphatase-like protein [Trichoderma camerunense]
MATKERIPACRIRTRCLIISDTHGMQLPVDIQTPVDVAIHCGDLTQHSRLDEFQSAIELIEKLNAPLKIVIAGNHDFSLDIPIFKQKILEANRLSLEPLDNVTIRKEYGDYGTARQMLQESRKKGIIFVDEGSHRFSLQNGALLRIYASPYTPSTASSSGWGFQYSGIHNFEIENGIDIVVTHGPPQGIMDLSAERKRIGCPQLLRLSQKLNHEFTASDMLMMDGAQRW